MSQPEDDVGDPVQGAALVALGAFVSEALDRIEIRGDPGAVTRVHRVAFFYLAESLQLLGDACLLLRPGDNVFAHARAVSGILRTLVDVFGRQLAIWTASDPNLTMSELLADSIAKERRALENAADAGIDVRDLDANLQEAASSVGVSAHPLNVTSTLREHGEHELLSVFQWESSFVHLGAAAIASGGRSVTLKSGQTIDVMLWPVSLWRVAQLTWATYGVGMRVLSLIESKAGFDSVGTSELDTRFRETILATANRPRPPKEPPSPPYGQYRFELYA